MKNTLAPSSGFAASGSTSKNAADHLEARAVVATGIIEWNQAEPDTFSFTPSRLVAGPPDNEKGDASPTVGIKRTCLQWVADTTRRADRQQTHKSRTFSSLNALPAERGTSRDAVPAVQDRPATYSRSASVNLGPSRASSLTRPDAFSRIRPFFRSFFTNRRATSPMLPQVSLVAPSRCSPKSPSVAPFGMSNRSTIHVGKIRKVV